MILVDVQRGHLDPRGIKHDISLELICVVPGQRGPLGGQVVAQPRRMELASKRERFALPFRRQKLLDLDLETKDSKTRARTCSTVFLTFLKEYRFCK